MEERQRALDAAHTAAFGFLGSLDDRPVWPRVGIEHMLEAFGGPLPDEGMDAAALITDLAARAEPGLVAIPGGRFFGGPRSVGRQSRALAARARRAGVGRIAQPRTPRRGCAVARACDTAVLDVVMGDDGRRRRPDCRGDRTARGRHAVTLRASGMIGG